MRNILKLLIGFMLMIIGTGFAFASSYTIQHGDTLSAIAIAHKTTVPQLLEMNPSVTNPDKIFAGRTLAVSPTATATSTPSVLRRSVTSVPPKPEGQEVREQSMKTSACAPLRAIEKFSYPKAVAESFVAMVTEELQSVGTVDREQQEHHFTIESAHTRYTFTYTERCTFAKSEATITPLVASAELPDSTGPPAPLATNKPDIGTLAATHLRTIGQGEAVVETSHQALKRFLEEAIGPPYDVRPIMETMAWREQLTQWGLNPN